MASLNNISGIFSSAYGMLPGSDTAPSRDPDGRRAYSLLWPLTITFLVLYIPAVQVLRFRRARQAIKYVRDNQPLTPATAQRVVQSIAQLEFPMMHQKALEFALFRTYGIPSISKLLVQTTLFARESTAGRRYADTKILIGEFMGRDWGSRAWVTPMARLNAIHGHYRDKGKICEADMLYTLLLFAQQTSKWIDRFEWRQLSHEEEDALGTFWRGVSEAMEINYDGLGLSGWQEGDQLPVKANGRGKGVWKDGADWIKAVDEWAERYEERHMVPDNANAELAEYTMQLLLYEIPPFLHPLGRQAVAALMDNRLRRAMKISPPSTWVHCTVMSILLLRKFVTRWLILPRPDFWEMRVITDEKEATEDGLHHLLVYDNYPYFIQPTIWNRWGPRAWRRWLSGLPLPGDKGMEAQGYVPAKVGPGVGKAPVEQARREQRIDEVLAGRGCPLAFSR